MQPARLDTATIARRTAAMQKALARARMRGAATVAISRDADGGEIHSVLPAKVSSDALHRMPKGGAWVVRVYQPPPPASTLLAQRQAAIEQRLRQAQARAARIGQLLSRLSDAMRDLEDHVD